MTKVVTKPRIYLPEDQLKHKYLIERKTILKISKEFGCDCSVVSRELKRYGVIVSTNSSPARNTHLLKLTDEFLKREVCDLQKPIYQIAEESGCGGEAIVRRLRSLGIKVSSGVQLSKSTLLRLQDKKFLEEEYRGNGRSRQELSKEIGCDVSVLDRYLKIHGIPLRGTYEVTSHTRQKNRTKRKELFASGWVHPLQGKNKSTTASCMRASERMQQYNPMFDKATVSRAQYVLKEKRRNGEIIYPWQGKTKEEYFGTEKALEIHKKKSRAQVLNLELGKCGGYTNTRPHRQMRRILKWVLQLPVQEEKRVEGFCVPDMILPEKKIAFFADGDYWHANPELVQRYQKSKLLEHQKHAVKRDETVNKFLKEKGWKVVRAWDSVLKKNPEVLISQVREVLKNG